MEKFPDKYQTMVYPVSPAHPERFAIRLIATNSRGITSFKELRTVNGREYATAIEAAEVRFF